MAALDDEAGEQSPANLRRIVVAASMGTIFEAYDFILFGSLAPIISRHFFSSLNETSAFIFTLLVFAAGFVVRPAGALLFGRMGDKTGRKRAFLITITIMGLATFAIGLLPTYEEIGIWAPILLIALRLFQGLAFGGEYGGAVVYTAEHAPAGHRGLYVGWIQTAAGFALFTSFVVIYAMRNLLGEEAFADWGWRVPFLISIVLFVFSICIRLTLQESPVFRKMVAEGRTSRKPLTEAFGQWRNLRLVVIVLFGLMAVQGALWYCAHFYVQFFLIRILKVAPDTVTLIMMLVTGISVFLYVFFSWLTDKVGRKPVLLTGTLLAAITIFPLFHLLTAASNPALAAAQARAPVTVVADPSQCSLQFDPVGRAAFASSCDIAKSTLANLGVSYDNASLPEGSPAYVEVGRMRIASVEGHTLSAAALTEARARFDRQILQALHSAGYPDRADPAAMNLPLMIAIVLVFVIFAVMVYAPAATMAIEVFPTQVRYSALSLPYHIGSGWFGGFLPAITFAMVAANGNIYFGLWYPLIVAVVGALVLAFALPETKERDLDSIQR